MKLRLQKQDIIKGGIVYTLGDTIASLILGNVSVGRILGILFLGSIVYAFEIPNFLVWLEKKFISKSFSSRIAVMLLFTIYFNPLWIARHLLVLNLFSLKFENINWSLLQIGWYSFLTGLIAAIPANYLISNVIPLRFRFLVSGIFSGLMAMFFALSETFFK